MVGLVTGLIQNNLSNPRMGLAAHLEGLMNGTFLLALGAIWPNIQLSQRWKSTVYWTAIYGAAANWITTLFAAIAGTTSMTPLAGVGHGATVWYEAVVTCGFISVGLAMLTMAGLTLWGLRAGADQKSRP